MNIVETEPTMTQPPDKGTRVRLPAGMVGLPGVTEFELVTSEDAFPVMWLRSIGGESLNFPVVEPAGLVANYQLELSDADAEFLGGISEAKPPLVLTVLTVKSLAPQRATVNLVAPIVINRETFVGKQVLLANYERYSIEHPVLDESAPTEVGKC
jgi:flagellar assembly factor FliW